MGFRVLRFRVQGYRGLRFRARVQGFKGLRFRVQEF